MIATAASIFVSCGSVMLSLRLLVWASRNNVPIFLATFSVPSKPAP